MVAAGTARFAEYYRAPVPALLAMASVILWQGLAHTIMILMERVLGHGHVYQSATAIGALGAWLIWYGRNKGELPATLLGFAGGSLVWTTWVEFSYHFYARHLGIPPLMENGAVVTNPEYLVMPSTVGFLMAVLLFLVLNRETRCNAFRWVQRVCRLDLGEPGSGKDRNIASIVALEVNVVTLFFYLILLALYDQRLFGEQHPATYGFLFVALAWSAYLGGRLLRFQQMAPAIRYAIPTGIIFWNVVEILGRWNLFTEIWIHPENYILEMTVVVLALAAAVAMAMFSPGRGAVPRQERSRRSDR